MKRLFLALLALCPAALPQPAPLAAPAPHVINLSAPGQRFNAGVRGLALHDEALTRTNYTIGIPDTLAVSDGSALRGVAGGLYADLFDWRTRNGEARPTTLEFLRWARDHRDTLFVTVNMRGLVKPDPAAPGKWRYTDTSIPTLSRLAADWVRYVNRIVPRYRQGDTMTDQRDAAIMASLKWSSDAPGDRFDTLLKRGEKPVPKVTYWEIGNEPNISVNGGIGVTNGIDGTSLSTLSGQQYHDRYKAIAAAMKAEDPRIKVGPCIVNGKSSGAQIKAVLDDTSLPVDFISYHPYQKLEDRTTPAEIEAYLSKVAAGQERFYRVLHDLITTSGRDPRKTEMVASETNVSNWPSNDKPQEGQMAHALGSVESIFTWARLGLTAAHYWIYPTNLSDGTKYPVYWAFAGLRDHMGDTLLESYSEANFRLYTTRDSATGAVALWGLNWDNARDKTLRLALRNASGPRHITVMTLGATSGKTTLFSANLSPSQAGGPKNDVAWTTTHPANLDPAGFTWTFPAATLTVIEVEKG